MFVYTACFLQQTTDLAEGATLNENNTKLFAFIVKNNNW